MADDDFQGYMLENTEIIDLPDGDVIAYPAGALFGPAYRLPGNQSVAFYHWRLARLTPSPARRWATRAAVFAGLVLAVGLGRLVAGTVPAIDLFIAFAALIVLTAGSLGLAIAGFHKAFPAARRMADPDRRRRLILAYICHPAFALWKCALIAGVFAVATVTLGRILWLTAGSLPVQAVSDLAAAAFVLTALFVMTAVPGWLATRHLSFWRRHGHLPQPEDVQTPA